MDLERSKSQKKWNVSHFCDVLNQAEENVTLEGHIRGWARVQKRSGSLTIGLALALGRARGGFRSVLFLGSSDRNSLYSLSILYTLFCICCISHTYFLKETSRIHNLNYSKCEVGFFFKWPHLQFHYKGLD